MASEEIRVYGTVQGVGFRPTVYRLARKYSLLGEVCNDSQGVLIKVCGSQEAIEEFIQRLQQECPPLATISQITRTRCESEFVYDDFAIAPSIDNIDTVKTEIPPDAATCSQCQAEIFNPESRWYRYPFTNCTHCGPRLSIIRGIPYDRHNTSMSVFGMCSQCAKEYNDVENRRFHAQPIACHICGPKVTLERADGKQITASMFSMLDDVDAVCTLLQKGEIVAIKGLGGIHLACDATNESAVQKLRHRKQRHHKPFALMARDITIIEQYCIVSSKEKELLESPAAPIVVLRKWGVGEVGGVGGQGGNISPPFPIPPSLAPGQNTLGFMLPYTPLHHLILRRMNRPIVFTSGNVSDEPQCIDNDQAREKLGKIADYFLLHNREIVNRVDDSVVRVVGDKVQIIRRARGYAPTPINLPSGFENSPSILAMGGELKNTFCLLQQGRAILSPHLGDLENAATFKAYQQSLSLYLNIFQHTPQRYTEGIATAIAVDLHPEYLLTKLGKQLATANQIKLHLIQHHHAHIAACMAENNIPLNSPPILGIAFDGLGYGEDGTFWGGEFFLANYQGFQRLATFKPVAMLGGDKAMKQPWRNTYAQLVSAFSWEYLIHKYHDLELIQFLQTKPLKLMSQVISQGINSPLTSSVGRLFDAVAAAIGICREECNYQGQAAIQMEALVDLDILNNLKDNLSYSFNINKLDNIYYIDSYPMWSALLNDLQHQLPPSVIAAKFHQSLANVVVEITHKLCQNSIKQVALSGGVFQNSILLQQVKTKLELLGITVLTHSLVPCNDGGLSLGQAVIAAARLSIEKN